ncbi:ABC transporter substrate-binding protein [Paracoccus seriniphilus]|uniref:Glycine betaine/proline transport system substrate-binding protein n=1 Tax=Paracoccus seriniphilus TaxID=184748 RepID=A0A239Q2V4_9RHOB|nr:ABC transporter substrate-binding protein [Paracoccus seriniphilus]WCR16106.1 ABC transporter substrate-binding protein [Paracoccus seriniphilus]SNT76277.1 glycine betaine/proline transport system substrate-binding protein [Paracoccus seriniphilus]
MTAMKSALAVLGLMVAAPAAYAAEDCGDVTLAEMNWASAGLAAWVDKIILEEGYGCDVALVTGDTVPTFTSMNEKAEPDIAPELWVNAVKVPLDAAVAEGRIVIASEILTDGGVEGFWIPTKLAEEHGIKTIHDALEHPELFPGAEDSSKGAFFNCPSGWACQIITQNQFIALDAEEKGFELIDSGSAAGLDGSIARAFNRDEGWLGYYWSPTAILGKYDMTKLDLGVEHDKESWDNCTVVNNCPDPKLNEWSRSDVFTAVTKEFADNNPVTMDYLGKRAWSNATVNELLAWMGDNQATNEDGAYYFLENYPEVWSAWLSEDVAAKVQDAL